MHHQVLTTRFERHAQAANRQQEQQELQQRRANGEPPWQGELEENEALRYAGSVSAPVSRSGDSYSYTPPRPKPSEVRLTQAQAEIARQCAIDYQTYAMHLLEMEERKRRGDMQL